MALDRLWLRVEQVARVAHAATDLAHAQASLEAVVDADLHAEEAHAVLSDFLASRTVASMEQMLSAAGHRLSVRQATLALGMLLQPAMAQGASRLNKVLCLPLPQDPAARGAVACWWLAMVLGFFARHEVELGLFAATVEAVVAAVEAPGEAPNRATIEESAECTISVPNSSLPVRATSFLMICTRCPAVSNSQSFSSTLG